MSLVRKTDHNTGITSLPFLTLNCTGSFKSPDRVSGDWAHGLMSLCKKTQKSNYLKMLDQRQHLLNYFKTLSVGPARNQTQAFHTTDWHLTNLAKQVSFRSV